ncbi:hypothetical protein JXC34_01260 [Candidatus Woesearchaeota archaeon]|nr:hypothetical protein [Candidatus Woesearchaeota archaeon]
MSQESEAKYEKKVNKLQEKLEKKELHYIQDDYKKKVPAYIWFLKLSIVTVIFINMVMMPLGYIDVVESVFIIIAGGTLFFGFFDRKRWSWYFGLFLFCFGILASIVSEKYLEAMAYLGFFVLLFIHKDYLNKKMPKEPIEEQILSE